MPRFVRAAALVALSATVGCRDGSAPESLQIDLRADVIGPARFEDVDDFPNVSCDVVVTVDSRGSGRAVWHGGVLRFYFGRNPSELADSVLIPRASVSAAWGYDTLVAGRSVPTEWVFSHIFPFDADLELQYRPVPGSEIQRSSVSARCGSSVDPGSPLPVVDAVTVQSGPAQPGDSVTISYSASSTSGLWATVVTVDPEECTDSLRTFSEHLQSSVTRTMRVKLNVECPHGTLARATVAAYDASARFTARTSQAGIVVGDEARIHIRD